MTRFTTHKRNHTIRFATWICVLTCAWGGFASRATHASEAGHGHEDEHADHEEAEAKGPNGGRLFESGDFALELAIVEEGRSPEFRAWATSGGSSIPPTEINLEVELARLGGQVESISFEPRSDHLVSQSPVAEPHSFEVTIEAVHEGRKHSWSFESFEGRTQIDPAMAASLGVETSIAGPAVLTQTVKVYGRVLANAERTREIRARFEGVVRTVSAREGDEVRKGDELLTVESNESLNVYTIYSPINGIVLQRAANPDEQTSGRLLMRIVDPSSVWVDLSVHPRDRAGVRVGAPVTIVPALGGSSVESEVSLLKPVADPHDQSVVARVVVDDPQARLLPGTFVTAHVSVAEVEVPLAVERIGIQSFRESQVVYALVGDVYEVRMLELGRKAGDFVEVLGGLEPGTRYVTANSHLIKADIEKSGATHDH